MIETLVSLFALEFENWNDFMGVEIIYSEFDVHEVTDM